MSFEKYVRVYEPGNDITLRYGDSVKFNFNANSDKEYRLFFTGETTQFYFWKGEYDCVAQYCNIEDALSNKKALIAPYCLDLSNNESVTYPKVAFKKVTFPPTLSYLRLHSYGDDWKVGAFVKATDLNIYKDNGYLKLTYEVRFKKNGMPAYDTHGEPDEIYTIEIPQGTYDWQELSMDITLPKDKIGNVVCYIECDCYTGELLIERPYINSSNGFNILPDFQPPYLDHDKGSWLGHNLSRKEWPEFEIKLNGNTFFSGEMFERCHRYSECECNIPAKYIKDGQNEIEIKLISSYPNPLPYRIHEVGIFEQDGGAVRVIACPENAVSNDKAAVLIKTAKPNVAVSFECKSGLLSAETTIFNEAGLNVFSVDTHGEANDVDFKLIADGKEIDCTIKRVVSRQEDNVYTGTGDMVYVSQEKKEDVEEYISWYVSENIGNLLTIRPTYRWCGARVLNNDVWRYVCDIANKLNMKYVHMTDGREFPGGTANPSLETLDGKGFLGRQSHEYDGAFGYWGHGVISGIGEAVADYWMRLIRNNPLTANTRAMEHNYVIDPKTEKMYNYVDPYNVPDDMEGAANMLVQNLYDTRVDHTRHTGPSVVFKYFFQAGYEWVGAELMYGPLEMITAFMRGAAYCYDQKSIGGHLAIQWSTTPHDTEDRYRRYGASLFSSYLQGINDINTEEGLWHLEEYYSYFSRVSDACINHKKQQQNFNKYVQTHSRTGEFYTPFAFVYGRYDGFRSFGRDTVFARYDFNTAAPELSWELLDTFYPLEVANGEIYLHPCPNYREIGMLTGTPRGNIDVIPIECTAEKMQRYKVIAFLGYNKALPEDCDKLLSYASNGGKLVIGWPHLSETVLRKDVVEYNHRYIDHEIVRNISFDPDNFVEDTYLGQKLYVNASVKTDNADIVLKTDSGKPLQLRYRYGNGEIYFVNAREYPAEKSVERIYRNMIENISDRLNNEEQSFIKCNDDVQFAIYEQADGSRHIYVLAADWYRDPDFARNAEFLLDGNKYAVDVRFGAPVKIVVNGKNAAWVYSDDADVISVDENSVKLQGYGKVDVVTVSNGKLEHYTVDFADSAVKYIALN